MILAQIIIFILGWPLEWTEIIVIFMPIFLPLLKTFNVDPLFFGLLVALNIQTSFLSPPVAMAPFYLKGVAPKWVNINDIFRGVMPYHAHRHHVDGHALHVPADRAVAADPFSIDDGPEVRDGSADFRSSRSSSLTGLIFWALLPRGGKLHRWVNTELEPYISVALCAGVALGFTMTLSGVLELGLVARLLGIFNLIS